MNTPKEFYAWLLPRVRDGGTNALNEIAALARDEREVMIKGPAMAALLCWKEIGIEKIVEIAQASPTSKNLSAAYKLLSATAAGGEINLTLLFLDNHELAALINDAVTGGSLRHHAREYLAELLQSIDTFDLLIPLGTAFSQMGLVADQGASELIRAMSSRWLRIGPRLLKEYAHLISAHPNSEPIFQQFFCKHPQILDPMAQQIWSRPDFHGAHEPDFVIRRADNSYLIVEIETPGKQLVTQAAQLSADATHAEKQATDYRQFLDERLSESRRHFPEYSSAECLAVIGLENSLAGPQLRSLANANAGRHKVRIAGFDWLAKRAHAIIENVSSGEPTVFERYRVI
jgi:hypothetical protein